MADDDPVDSHSESVPMDEPSPVISPDSESSPTPADDSQSDAIDLHGTLEPEPVATRGPAESTVVGEHAERTGADAGEDEDASTVHPDDLRVDPSVAAEMFGDNYTHTTAHGPAQFGNHNTTHNHYGPEVPDPIIGLLPDVEKLMATYALTDADEPLDELISQRATVCLVGHRNSGRYSTACAALGRRYKPDRLYEIQFPTDVPPETLNNKPDRLPDHSGFVLRHPGRGHVDTMRKLADLFRRRDSTLLLIKDEATGRWDRPGAEVRHHSPDPVDVFKRHLAALLPNAHPQEVERYLTENVRAALKAVYGPKESVAVAYAIAKAHPANDDTVRAVLNGSQPRRRERAAAILLPGKDAPTARSRRAGQHERAFRLAYAVFHRRSVHYVFEAAELLLREIDSAALRPDWGSMVLQHPVHELLGDELSEDWRTGRDVRATRGRSGTAWIRDPGLRGAIIDVAWHDFDGTRKALLRWLHRLADEGDDIMRRAAAETAGLLVHHDFDRVHDALVDTWAGSPKPALRQAAAWTMTISDMAGDVGPKVRAKLSQWCSGSSNYQRDTAARVYASGLEQAVLAWSMYDLARIAANPLQKRRRMVAAAVNQLYKPDRAGWILTELDLWTRVSLPRVHAARAVLLLAARVETESFDGRPDLLERLAEGNVDVGHLGRLWRVALLEPDSAPLAANTLARWIGHASAHVTYRRHVTALLDVIAAAPVMRRRLMFYLMKSYELREGLPEWMTQARGWGA